MGRRKVYGSEGGQTLLETALAQATTSEAIREIQCAITSIRALQKECKALDREDHVIQWAIDFTRGKNNALNYALKKVLEGKPVKEICGGAHIKSTCIPKRKYKKAKNKGVYYNKTADLWASFINHGGVRIRCGSGKTEEIALECQRKKKEELGIQ